MKKSCLLGVVCAIISTVSTPINAIEILTYGEVFQYSWSAGAEAELGDSGTFYESDGSLATVQHNNWLNPAYTGYYSGSVVSPIPSKTYDTSPIAFQQPDLTFDTTATFNESWTVSNASAGVNESIGLNQYNVGISSSSTADAQHALDSYFTNSIGYANASSFASVSLLFDVYASPGEADTFTIDGSYLHDVSASLLVSEITLSASIDLWNTTTGEHLYSYLYNDPFDLWQSTNDVFSLYGLSTQDTYSLDLVVATSAFAQSTNQFVLDDPLCDVSVPPYYCYGNTVVTDQQSAISTFLDFNIGVQASVVPIPPALWLFGSGLLGLIGLARRKKA